MMVLGRLVNWSVRSFVRPLSSSCHPTPLFSARCLISRSSTVPIHSSVFNRPLQCLSNRTFSSQSAVSADLSDLVKALGEEIVEEKKLEVENLGGNDIPQIPGFQINPDAANVTLTKKFNDELITVYMNVNHSVDMDDDFAPEEEGGEQMEDEGHMPVATPPFSVEVTKGDRRLCFQLEICESSEGDQCPYDFRVEEFYMAPAGDAEIDSKVYSSSGKYIDQKLHDLLFMQYLEKRGIDAQFCENLVKFATHYEHCKYVELLEQIKAFVSK